MKKIFFLIIIIILPMRTYSQITGGGSRSNNNTGNNFEAPTAAFLPKPFRINLTWAGFKFLMPNEYTEVLPNFQVGLQKSSYSKKTRINKRISDIGYEVDFSWFTGMKAKYGTGITATHIDLTKYYLGYNRYLSFNLKHVDLAIQGGAFLNYNRGKIFKGEAFLGGEESRAGFLATGIHLGEQIQKGFGKSAKGYSRMIIALGFDHYFAFKGGYIGSFGVTLSF